MIDIGAADVETALQLARVMGSSMARIAESQVSPAARLFDGAEVDSARCGRSFRPHRRAGDSRPCRSFSSSRGAVTSRRRGAPHHDAARPGSARGELPQLAVGFADMVGFTMLSQQLSEEELAAVVSRFEEVGPRTSRPSLGGRVVKMIGDEAMFVSESVEADARASGWGWRRPTPDDELLSDVRVGPRRSDRCWSKTATTTVPPSIWLTAL